MPKPERDLFGGIASFPALIAAAMRAAKGKRAKPGVAAFLANLETEALRLERQLLSGAYRPGRYKRIEIFDPKHRIVSAAPFRDRVVHHAFCALLQGGAAGQGLPALRGRLRAVPRQPRPA